MRGKKKKSQASRASINIFFVTVRCCAEFEESDFLRNGLHIK